MTIGSEIKDLLLFGYELREENKRLFNQMMSELAPEVLEKTNLAKYPSKVIAMAQILATKDHTGIDGANKGGPVTLSGVRFL
jgi:hypothetical protein